MQKILKNEYKFKCYELACGKIVRGDKWQKHCHVFLFGNC